MNIFKIIAGVICFGIIGNCISLIIIAADRGSSFWLTFFVIAGIVFAILGACFLR